MILSQGSISPDVRKLQQRLNALGYKDSGNCMLTEDGSFGPRTEQAVDRFKDAILPDGNKDGNRGKVGETTWEYLNAATPLPPHLIWLPPYEYNDGGKPWTDKDKADFASFEAGNKLIWGGCTAKLLSVVTIFEAEIKKRGWTIDYTSAYRPLVYQAHFYDIWKGPASKTAMGQAHCRQHGIKSASYPRRANSPHILGVAFDARVKDGSGRQLNPDGAVNAELVKVAGDCGLRINMPHDNVHFQLV